MADFSNFELGQNVHELAGGLIPEMAEVFEVNVGDTPDVDALGVLVGAIGKKKTLSDNKEGAMAWLTEQTGSEDDALELAAGWMERSGVQKALGRSLWTPDTEMPGDDHIIVATGAVANWQDRVATLLEKRAAVMGSGNVLIPVGNRTMETPNEKANKNIQNFIKDSGHFPTETEYAFDVIRPRLEWAGYAVRIMPYKTEDGDQIAAKFMEDLDFVMGREVLFARVANAGLQLAIQFRKAARAVLRQFDANPNAPQVFVATDHFPVAHTQEQASEPTNFQNPFTGIRQIALSAKLLLEASSSA